MRKQIAAANWKMNLTKDKAAELIESILKAKTEMPQNEQVLLAVPFPYLDMANERIKGRGGFAIAAQNCSHKKNGAYTGEVSVEMLQSVGVGYCIVGHSERREGFGDTNSIIAQKIDLCLAQIITPIFCCGEALEIREAEHQNDFVRRQIEESLYHLSSQQIEKIIIAYEPIWAIGTGKTATTEQAQQMHNFIRSVLTVKWGDEVAGQISILYGGSVKASNATELFSSADVDGGLVGGASLVATEFIQIINALKH